MTFYKEKYGKTHPFWRVWQNTIAELDRYALKYRIDFSKVRIVPGDPDGADYSVKHAKYNKKAPLRDRRSDATR